MRDPRDEPQVETDVNGDMFFVSQNGKRITVEGIEVAKLIEKVEKYLKFSEQFPMGMK